MTETEQNELDFLRYFFYAAGEAFGPADYEVYRAIMENYMENHDGTIPHEYRECYGLD